MHTGNQTPVVATGTPMQAVVHEISGKGLGMVCVVDDDRLVGVITDGDLRRYLSHSTDIVERTAGDLMTTDPITIQRETFAAEVLNVLEKRKITSIVVVDDDRHVEGVVHLHDLWRTGLF
jgi:arabinose-5-phosphate isomerase